ncbi:MAG: M23 family metallopeptidase [Bacteroidota bacterium]
MKQLFLFLSLTLLFSQAPSRPAPDFGPPVRGLMQLTGTFGELRGNHFHGGIDIRGGVGRSLFAIADGFVSRVKVSVSGYGQALYLQHPSGYTSVYGHMNRFRADIADTVKNLQYRQETFKLDHQFPPGLFPVKKGDLIGFIGQRGFVSGPHLHFEIRDTETERLLNPMNFGITVADHRRPFINAVRLYELSERGQVLSGRDYAARERSRGQYALRPDTLWVQTPTFGLAIKSYDQQDGRPNFNGIYSQKMWQDDSLRFQYFMDDFDGRQTRYLNAHLDYAEQRLNNSWYQRSYCMPGNELDFYQMDAAEGRLTLAPGQATTIRYRISDHMGNVARMQLVVKRRAEAATLLNPVYTYYFPYDERNVINDGKVYADFPLGTLYEDLYLDYDQVTETTDGLFSHVHRFGRSTTPLHRSFELRISPTQVPDWLRDKAIIAQCDDGDAPVSYGGTWTDDGQLRARVRKLGNYAIMLDTEAPTITPNRFGQDMRGWSSFSFFLDDNFPTAGAARGLRFRAEVDGQWILMEYDGRSRRLYHTFDGRIRPGQHELVLRVVDDRENETVLRERFVR